jgi:two-component system, NarL family, response regulator NreC
MKVKILVADDHALIRKGVISILTNHDPEWEVFEAENGIQAILKAGEIKPDIILMDYLMPKLDGVNASLAIRKDTPGAKIIMVTMDMSEERIISMINAGVMGIVPKDSPADELLNAIEEVNEGKHHMKGKIVDLAYQQTLHRNPDRKRPKTYKNNIFSAREKEILASLVQGLSAQKIATKYSISKRTVETHKANIFKKSRSHSTASLIRYAITNRIIEL